MIMVFPVKFVLVVSLACSYHSQEVRAMLFAGREE